MCLLNKKNGLGEQETSQRLMVEETITSRFMEVGAGNEMFLFLLKEFRLF